VFNVAQTRICLFSTKSKTTKMLSAMNTGTLRRAVARSVALARGKATRSGDVALK
jgi:hypothetical protein